MNYKIPIIFFASLIFFPAFGQEMTPNESLTMAKFDINWNDFNIPSRDAVIIPFDEIHKTNWQINLENKLLYGNPEGTAVVRLYDANFEGKFVEIGMGGIPDRPFWVAVQLPEEGYIVVHDKLERGWLPGAKVILAYSDTAGLTINNGERIVISNLDVESLAVEKYSVWGMKGSQDPPATTDGFLNLEVISGDPTKGPLHMFPFFVVGALGCVVVFLLVSKKRN
jgi:hypothetical protein